MVEALSAAFLGAQVLVLLGAAIVAWWQLGEATKSREQQTRPFVVADFDVDNNQLIFVVFSNVGRTVARNVRFNFSPPLASALDSASGDDPPFRDAKLIREGIPTLPPGRRIPALFDFAIQRHGRNDLPDVYSVTITYTNADGTKNYTDEAVLDLGIYWNVLHVGRKDVDDIHKRLEELVKVLKGWDASYGSGLHVVDDADLERRADAFRQRFKERRAKQEQTDADAGPAEDKSEHDDSEA